MFKKLIVMMLVVAAVLMLAIAPAAGQDMAFEEGSVLNVAWPYQVPPTGHFNTFASNGITLGIYFDIHEPPLAMLIWADGVYDGIIADEFGWDEDGNYVITVAEGYNWSDGSPLSADDVMATFELFRLRGDAVWSTLTGLEKVDDMTVKFLMDAPSSLAERQILTSNIRAASVYGDLAARAAEVEVGSDAAEALLTELTEFRPEVPVSAGPYTIDPDSINEANLMMVHNPGGIASDIVQFESMRVWNGETEVVTPLVANEELHYITHGIPPTTEDQFVSQGLEIVRIGQQSGPGIYLNYDVYPLDLVEVRQAIAHAIDREQNGFVSLGESGVAVEYMTGMSDGLAETWLSDETLDSLNYYEYNPEGAAALLESVGFSLNDDGIWTDADGNTLSFELIFPQEFADWSAAAENATAQLNDFGFDITARGVTFQQQEQEVYDSNFEMAIRNWGIGSPIPAEHYLQPYQRYNGQGEFAGDAGGGMGFDLDVTYSGGDVNVLDLTIASGQGIDRDVQSGIVEQLAVSYNELLPAIPLWERYSNNTLNRAYLDMPPIEDKIYTNFSSTDSFMAYYILHGQVGPAQ